MLKIFKKQKFNSKLFITASVIALILLPVLFIFLKSLLINEDSIFKPDKHTPYSEKGYYFDKSDPYMTKVVRPEDLITEPVLDGKSPSMGSEDATVTIVEYSDFECIFCENQEKTLKQVLEKYKGKIKLIWKDYPINDELSPSYRAAIAARCAQKQDKFWEYHDLLFEESHNLNTATFNEIAQELNLDTKVFKNCLENKNTKKLIDDNITEANALRINGIPFVFINKQEIMGEITIDEIIKIIEIELNK